MLFHLPIVFAAALPLTPVAAASVPRLDIARECRAEVGDQTSQKRCIDDDDQARKQLEREWSSFNASERRLCGEEARMGGASSYVELLTCLEMSRDTRTGQPSGRAADMDPQEHATTGQAGSSQAPAK